MAAAVEVVFRRIRRKKTVEYNNTLDTKTEESSEILAFFPLRPRVKQSSTGKGGGW